MNYLTEDKVKEALRQAGLPVMAGIRADSPDAALQAAEKLGGDTVVKALVATGRRGKAGAVRMAATPQEAETAAAEMFGTSINGHVCDAVYVEKRAEIAEELYLSFVLEDYPPRVLVSTEGGGDIEAVHRDQPEAILAEPIDPLRGVPVWDAVDLWERAGLASERLPAVARVTEALYDFFVRHDGVMLELNPLVLDAEGRVLLVGAMLATEDAMFQEEDEDVGEAGDDRARREARLRKANRDLPGGMIRYKELDGDIGMFVGGGGASLHQHDLILAAGGKPANHTDASTMNPDKVRVLFEVILDNPNVRSLFISWHYQQMAQIDKRVIPALEALRDRGIDPAEFPVVIRMFGRGEETARKAAAEYPGVHYLPHGAPMTDGIELIVRLTAEAHARTRQKEGA